MKKCILIALLSVGARFVAFAQAPAPEPADSRATLEWVQKQAQKIESLLHAAILQKDYPTLLLRLTQAAERFSAVTYAGLYCHEARAAAERGRRRCMIVSDDYSTDMNALIMRAVEARGFAQRMSTAAEVCMVENIALRSPEGFALSEIFEQDASLSRQVLDQSLVKRDYRHLTLKLEQAINIMREVQVLAESLDDCAAVAQAAQAAHEACLNAILADNWAQTEAFVSKARALTAEIEKMENCR